MLLPVVERHPAGLEGQGWHKLGLVYRPGGGHVFSRSHAQVPSPVRTIDGNLRVYYGTRDAENRTTTTFLDLDPDDPTAIKYLHDRPVMSLGALGCFDDAGVMPGCVVNLGAEQYLYYAGWNTSTTVSYRLSIGLAVSRDGGLTFERMFDGPILDRTAREPHLCGAPFVLRDGEVWRMWYPSGTEWLHVDGRAEPRYLIRYAESTDGVAWQRPGTIAIHYERPDEALARPWVVKDRDGYRMWYSSRSIYGYRSNALQAYRLGYATSHDGLVWERHDELAALPTSASGWDSEMIAYPAVIDLRSQRYLLYNGNGFGSAGFGIARRGEC